MVEWSFVKYLIYLYLFFRFEGYWVKYHPVLGEFIIPDENKLGTKHRILVYGGGSGKILAPIEPLLIQDPKEIIKKGEIQLNFLTNDSYSGQINNNFDLMGWGHFKDENGDEMCGFYTQIGFTYEFDVNDESTMKFFNKHKAHFFKDSEKYMKENPEINELPMLMMKNKNIEFCREDIIG